MAARPKEMCKQADQASAVPEVGQDVRCTLSSMGLSVSSQMPAVRGTQ